MKRFLMTTAIVLTTAGAAVAQSNDALRAEVGNFLATSPYMVDVNSLTDAQIAELHGAYTSSEDASERHAKVEAVINDNNVEYTDRPMIVMVEGSEMDRSQLYQSVSNALIGTKYEGMAYTLSDAQLAQAYGAVNSSDDASTMETKLSAVFE